MSLEEVIADALRKLDAMEGKSWEHDASAIADALRASGEVWTAADFFAFFLLEPSFVGADTVFSDVRLAHGDVPVFRVRGRDA